MRYEYYLICSKKYPNKLFFILKFPSLSGDVEDMEPLIEKGLGIMVKEGIPIPEYGITNDFEVDLSIGSKAFYKIGQLSRLEALSLVSQYRNRTIILINREGID